MSARLAFALGLLAGVAAAQEPAAPEARNWPCRFCTFDSGASGWLEPALGALSDASFHFGDATGLEEQGTFLDFSGAWRYRDAETASAWDVRVAHAGLEAREFDVRGGRQGAWSVALGYESLERLRAADARSPFAGAATLALPPGWTEAGSTSAMSDLDASLRGAALRQQRERLALGVAFAPRPALDLRFDYRRDEIRGTAAVGASFMTLASELPRPLDSAVDRVEAAAQWRHPRGYYAQATLNASSFANDAGALAWQNPYSGPTAASRDGRLAPAPDNRAYVLSLAGGGAPDLPVQLAGSLALGRLRQDQRFVPATINPDEAAALPRASLDGKVDTLRAHARASTALSRAVRLTADVLRDERDNRTPVAAYTQVVMDTFTGDVRENVPYGSARTRWRLGVERRASPRLGAGVDQDRRERRLAGTATTDERTVWGRLGWRPFAGADLRLKASTAQRQGSELVAGAGAPAQNALLRAFDTADRDRRALRADFSLSGPGLVTAFNLDWTDDDYPDTRVGRTSDRELGYGADLVIEPRAGLALGAFASHRRQESAQAGSESFGAPDWWAQLEDTRNVVGVHAAWQAPRGLELGADYALATSEGAISMLATDAGGFPHLLTRWHDAGAWARYPLRPDLALRLDLMREVYEASDWSRVAPDAVPNLLSLGAGSQSGSVTAVVVSARWRF